MLNWLKQKLKWLLVAMAVAGPVFAVIGWMDVDRVNDVTVRGIEGDALITGAVRKKGRKSGTNYYLNLAWKDGSGADQRAEEVRISHAMAGRLFRDDRIVVDRVRIKYLADNPAKEGLVLLDDVDEELGLDRFMMWGGAIIGIVGLLGCAFMFGLLGRLRQRPPREDLAGGPRSAMAPPRS
jgi:hypothetical protein